MYRGSHVSPRRRGTTRPRRGTAMPCELINGLSFGRGPWCATHEQSIGGARRLHAKFGMRTSERRPRIIADIPNLAWCRLAPPIDCSSVEMPLTLARDFFQRAPDELRVDAGGGRGGQELAGGDAGLGALLTRRLGRRAKRRDLEGGGALQHARRVAGGERGNRMLARAAERGF